MGLIDACWAINEVPMQLEVTRGKKAHQVTQTCNLDGIPMNIEESFAHHFRVQTEHEWTKNW